MECKSVLFYIVLQLKLFSQMARTSVAKSIKGKEKRKEEGEIK
jgi:hypothetical protein